MSDDSIDVIPEQLLNAVSNNLGRVFFEAPKNDAKNLYRKLVDGEATPFMNLSAGEQTAIACNLTLDHSQFTGSLTFSRFRNVLRDHLLRVADALTNNKDLNRMSNQETGDVIFYVPGITEENNVMNVLVTGFQQRKAGEITIQLMFLDPTNLSIARSV